VDESGGRRLAWKAVARTAWLVASVLWAAGCGEQESATGPRPALTAVCTTGMVGDLVEQVGGDRVGVTVLMGEGVDPHLYKVSPGDVRAMIRSDLIFYSGLHLEGKMGEVFARLSRRKPTVAVTESTDHALLLKTSEGTTDPHVWFDVALWSKGVEVVREALAKADPGHAAEYEANASAYLDRLEALDQFCRQQIASIPEGRRVLVTAHDAFGYFGRAYGLEVLGIQGLSTESEAGVREVNRLVDRITRDKLPAVFVESSLSDRNVRALVEGAAARGHAVKVGGELFSDAMGRPGTPEGTYEGMVRHNVETIVRALSWG
jgi:manganese/zinc/iron transport system substrate-binding protein